MPEICALSVYMYDQMGTMLACAYIVVMLVKGNLGAQIKKKKLGRYEGTC